MCRSFGLNQLVLLFAPKTQPYSRLRTPFFEFSARDRLNQSAIVIESVGTMFALGELLVGVGITPDDQPDQLVRETA